MYDVLKNSTDKVKNGVVRIAVYRLVSSNMRLRKCSVVVTSLKNASKSGELLEAIKNTSLVAISQKGYHK